MTVPAKIPADTHVGNGVTTQFAYSFLCFDKDDFKVFIDLALVDPAEYAVSDLGSPTGGMVTFSTPPDDGASVILRLDVVLDRQTNYQYEGDFLSPVVNRDFDRLWLSQQSQQVDLNAAVRFPPGESVSFLPAVNTRKGKALVFDPVTGAPKPSVDDYDDQAANAAASAAAAEAAKLSAQASQAASAASETNAGNYAASALASKNAAGISETNAADSEAAALAYKNAAATSETNAGDAASAAGAAAGVATSARDTAVAAAGAASTSETNAATSETNAGNYAASASDSADRAEAAVAAGGWMGMPVGMEFPLHPNAPLPPTDDPSFRYIILTAGLDGAGQYNEGVLTDETVTGSDPTITATATVSLAGSPMNGQTIDLINTSRVFLRPGPAAGPIVDSQNKLHAHTGVASEAGAHNHNIVVGGNTGSGVPAGGIGTTRPTSSGGNHTHALTINGDGGQESSPRYIPRVYLMRIL